jgi:hypothetical protein
MVVVDAAVTMRTQYKRVFANLAPLTQENRSQCLAEESLTLSRNGVCSPPSARPSFGGRVFGSEGGTLRRGWYALSDALANMFIYIYTAESCIKRRVRHTELTSGTPPGPERPRSVLEALKGARARVDRVARCADVAYRRRIRMDRIITTTAGAWN